MPRSFWRFNIGHLLTLGGGVVFAWMATLTLQSMVTTMQAATTANDKAIQTVASDLKEYRIEQARGARVVSDLLERVKETTNKTAADVAYLRGRSDRTERGGGDAVGHP